MSTGRRRKLLLSNPGVEFRRFHTAELRHGAVRSEDKKRHGCAFCRGYIELPLSAAQQQELSASDAPSAELRRMRTRMRNTRRRVVGACPVWKCRDCGVSLCMVGRDSCFERWHRGEVPRQASPPSEG